MSELEKKPRYPAVAAAAERHKKLEAEQGMDTVRKERRTSVAIDRRIKSRSAMIPAVAIGRRATDRLPEQLYGRRLVDHGPGYPGRQAEKEKEGNKYPAGEIAEIKTAKYIGPERRRAPQVMGRRFIVRRKTRLNADQEERSMAEERPDRPDKAKYHSSGRQLAEDQEDHPGYVKGAEVATTELWREFNRLMGEVQAEIDFITRHSGVSDVMQGRQAGKQFKADLAKFSADLLKKCQDQTIKQFGLLLKSRAYDHFVKHSGVKRAPGRLEAVSAKCSNCLFYAPTVYGVTSSGTPLPTIIGKCQRQAPMLHGSVVFPVVWPNVVESDWCGEHKPKV